MTMTPSAADSDAGRPMGRHELTELAMLADGSLPAARRAEVEARITAAPGGGALLANERRAVEAVRAASSIRAPATLRDRIAADRARAGGARRRSRVAFGGTLAGAVAALVLALAFVLPGGTLGSPSVSRAASLALRGPSSLAPPPTEAENPAKLSRNVDEVYFPNWAGIGWKATGERVDLVDGRITRTVYYGGRDHWQIAYTIVGGPALTEPRGAALSSRHGVQLRSIQLGARRVVTWRRNGHTCILSGRVPRKVLLALASGGPSA